MNYIAVRTRKTPFGLFEGIVYFADRQIVKYGTVNI